jgi:hypothetical protein
LLVVVRLVTLEAQTKRIALEIAALDARRQYASNRLLQLFVAPFWSAAIALTFFLERGECISG